MLQAHHEQTPRISQLLPSVKCSNCGQPVPLADLGDHVCPPLPPPLQKTPIALLPHRLQSLVARSATPPRTPPPEKSSEGVLPPRRDPFQPDKAKATPTSSNFPSISLDRGPTRLSNARTPPPERVSTPSRDTVSTRPSILSPVHPDSIGRPPSRPVALSPARRDVTPPPPPSHPINQSLAPPRSPFPNHPSPSVTPSLNVHPRPSFDRTSTSRPSIDKPRPSLDARRPSVDSQQRTLVERGSSAPPGVPLSRPPKTPSPAPVLPPALPHPILARQPPPPPLSLPHSHFRDVEIDTKTGGEAGMAGVGRRGFAAAARAAMLATSLSPSLPPAHSVTLGGPLRSNTPQYLDAQAILSSVLRAAMTPPLSPNSAQTPSPISPLSPSPISLGHSAPTNGQHHRLPSPHDIVFRKSPVPVSDDKAPPPFVPSGIHIASHSPSPIPNPFERRLSGETISQSPMTGTTLPLSLLDVLKPGLDPGSESDDDSVYTTHTDPKRDDNGPLSPSTDPDAGLAYAHDSDNDTPVVMPLDIRKSAMNSITNKVKFPTSASPHPSGPSRQISASSLRSALSSRSSATSFPGTVRARSASAATHCTARSGGALERAMETLIEEGASVSVLASGSVLASIGGSGSNKGSGKPSRSNTVPGPASPEQRPPKLPTRSHTSPSHPHIHTERAGLTGEVVRIRNRGSTKRKDRICARCNSKIEDGRWIQMDGGNVLCERCWKNMYLPKCRRCNLPIEKQAVSSRDGQLKGKYHKDCFNCDRCQKPFPDKEFYVFDGKPFCAYHYHEANNSLCGAVSCGQPIEGPCAVTHSGKRYHPEHLLCEFEDGCRERLEEYWEVDGQMLCERHGAAIGNRDSDCARDHDPVCSPQRNKEPGADEGRMMKRMTRFIDLGIGGDNELDIR